MKTTIAEMFGVILMSFDGVLALWWVTVPLVLFVLVSVANLAYRRVPLKQASVALLALVPAFALVFSAMAVLLEADPSSPTAVEDAIVPVRTLGGLGIVALLTAAACVHLAKSQRAVAASIALCGGWLVYWIFFVAAMSVSGTWL
jgi:hypothetical protein